MKKLFILFTLTANTILAQLCGGGTLQGIITPTATSQLTATVNSGRPYWTFSATIGCAYTFETCGLSTVDTELEILTSPGFTPLIYNDDACGLQSAITWIAPASGNYIIYLTRYNIFSCRAINGNVRIRYSTVCDLPLSPSLTFFVGENVNDENVLTWEMGDVGNTDYFTVEHSIDGVAFENVGVTKGFNLVDNTFTDTLNYYRLSSTDFDGKVEYLGDLVAIDNRNKRYLIGVFDLMGRVVDADFKGVKILMYSDGTRKITINI